MNLKILGSKPQTLNSHIILPLKELMYIIRKRNKGIWDKKRSISKSMEGEKNSRVHGDLREHDSRPANDVVSHVPC